MSEVKVNKITPRTDCGTTQLGDSGDTVTVAGDLKSNSLKATDGGVIISQSGTNITIGASGDTVSLASGASQSGFGRTGTVDWDTTPKTATFTAVSGDGFFANTTGGAFNMNLPAGVAGAIVSVADYAATWSTNALTVVPNGSDKIGGVNANVTLNTQGQSVTFIFVDSTQGWINTMDSTSNERGRVPFITASGGTETTSGDFKIHTFTGPGTFTVCAVSTVCSARNTVGYLVVGGGGAGGAGGSSVTGAGGGAGGYREGKNTPIDNFTGSPLVASAPTNAVTLTAGSFPIQVGGGGASVGPGDTTGNVGTPSIFSTITSAGGGGGGGNNSDETAGGSGGGGKESDGPGGAGNTPPVSPPQGNNGGAGSETGNASGGGGGAGAVGGPGNPGPAAVGGAGVSSSITASPVTRAGGGGSQTASGGSGGGGTGGGSPSFPNGGANNPGGSGTANTGGGGGGSVNNLTPGSGAGGSGIVIIRYRFQ